MAWADSIGGLSGLIARSEANLDVMKAMVEKYPWINFLAQDPATISNTSACFTVDTTPENVKKMIAVLDSENVAYDIGAYRDAPPGLRIWCGATVEASDLEALVPWIEYAYNKVTSE
jgi:phosphoserine aminotransferase